MRALLLLPLLAACVASEPAVVVPVQPDPNAHCLTPAQAAALTGAARETPLLLATSKGALYLFVGQVDGAVGSWTLFELRDGLACMVAHGVGWEMARPAGDPA